MLLHLWSKEKTSMRGWCSLCQWKTRITFHRYVKNPALNKKKIWAWVPSLSCSWNFRVVVIFHWFKKTLHYSFNTFLPIEEMVTLLGTTFSTNEQVVAQGDVNFMKKRSSHLSWNSTRKSMRSSSLLDPRAPGWRGNTTGSPLKSLQRLLQRWPA